MTKLPPLLLGMAVGLGLVYSLYLRSFALHGPNLQDPIAPHLRWGSQKTLGFEVIDVTDMVNVFIGTTEGGHVFPGATLPHGMVKVGMDTDSPGNVRVLFVNFGNWVG
jgi:hypothetical protein